MERSRHPRKQNSGVLEKVEVLARLSLPKPGGRTSLAPHSTTKIKSDSLINPPFRQPPPPSNFDTILNEFLFTVNLSNAIIVKNTEQATYKAFIDKGNNGLLLKSIVKRRWWWHLVDEADTCNLLWTEWTNREFVEKMGQGQVEEKEKGLRTEESTKQLGNLRRTVKVVENMMQKQSRIGKVINLGMFSKLNMKLSNDPDNYYIFSKKLTHGPPP